MMAKNTELILLLIVMLLISGCTSTGQIIKETDKREFLSLDVKIHGQVLIGEKFIAEIELIRHGNFDLVDILLEYSIKNESGNIITIKSETFAIQTRISTIESLNIPKNTKPGIYFFSVRASYDDVEAINNASFEIIKEPHIEQPSRINSEMVSIIVGIILIIMIAILLIQYIQYRKIKDLIKDTKR